MTEAEWLACTEPDEMLEYLRTKASERKLRLFTCACCRRVFEMLADDRSRSGLEAAEYYADNLGSLAENSEVREGCLRAMEDAAGDSESAELGHAKWHAACAAVCCTEIHLGWCTARASSQEVRQAEACYCHESDNPGVEVPFPEPEADGTAHAELLRDIIGNPFSPSKLDPSWLGWNGGAIGKAAAAAYEERELPSGHLENNRLAVLADMLEEAGATDVALLSHLREQGAVHVRGCWVIDLLLAKQ
jgi:hypothetical protein